MKKDQNYVVKVEQAISKKYGVETIQNPKGNWDQQKEKEYLDIKDVSVLSGFSISTIRRRIEEGVLKPIQEVPNGKLLFKRTNVEGWLNDGLQ